MSPTLPRPPLVPDPLRRVHVRRDLAAITTVADEAPAADGGMTDENVEKIWKAALSLYRSGAHPAIAVCVRREGVVVLEAIISTEGCVQDVQVLESADPALDLEAARAVTQWKYRPALLGGRPVRVYLTVTVTFRLN